MEVFARRAGVEMVHIPNKTGAAGMINDLVVGDAQVAFLNAASSAAMIRAGKLQPVAVLAEKRLPDYPDVPTLAEAGYPGRRHAALAEHAGARRDAEAGAGDAVQGDHRGREEAGAAGGVQEAACQRRSRTIRSTSRRPGSRPSSNTWRKTTAK